MITRQPGDPGLPGGGRPKGAVSLKTILNNILSGETTIEEAGIKRKVTKYEALALRLLQDALTASDPNVRLKAFTIIADRFEGKPKQEIEQSGSLIVSSGLDMAALTTDEKRQLAALWEKAKSE